MKKGLVVVLYQNVQNKVPGCKMALRDGGPGFEPKKYIENIKRSFLEPLGSDI